jgi:hypothetical protein
VVLPPADLVQCELNGSFGVTKGMFLTSKTSKTVGKLLGIQPLGRMRAR